jgi:hypothetical protein
MNKKICSKFYIANKEKLESGDIATLTTVASTGSTAPASYNTWATGWANTECSQRKHKWHFVPPHELACDRIRPLWREASDQVPELQHSQCNCRN